MRNMQPQYIYEVHTTDGERSSVRSSDDGASGSPGSDDRERARLEQKIYTVRERLKNINLEREHDVEEFLSTTKESEAQRGADNPQMARLKQHFERKNKRQKNDLEHLQKKLAGYEQRLFELDNGCALDTSGRSNVISTVGQGIRRTGANLKEMTESVIAAPLELAHKLKNTFGSADNVNESGDDSRVGHSTFYASSDHGSTKGSTKNKSSTLPPGLKMDIITSSVLQPSLEPQIDACREELRLATDDSNICGIPSLNVPTPISSSHDFLPQLNDELKGLRQLLNKMNDHVEKLEIRVETEVAFLNKTLDEERGKTLKLEMTLNETIELHQAEFQALKQEQQSIANRLDYQYNDRFKRVEESVESVQNHMYRMENSIKDTLDLRLGRSAWGNAALLSGVNILVELLKIILYLVATVLDFFLPFFGSRNKAGIFLCVLVTAVVLFQNVDVLSLIGTIFLKKNSSTIVPSSGNRDL